MRVITHKSHRALFSLRCTFCVPKSALIDQRSSTVTEPTANKVIPHYRLGSIMSAVTARRTTLSIDSSCRLLITRGDRYAWQIELSFSCSCRRQNSVCRGGSPLANVSSSACCSWGFSAGCAPLSGSPGCRDIGMKGLALFG